MTESPTIEITHAELMASLSVVQVQFVVESIDTVAFGNQPGSALRGALFETLAQRFCSEPLERRNETDSAYVAAHLAQCPVCRLLSPQSPEAARGQDVVRPLTIQPPLGKTTFSAGTQWRFGVSLVGKAQDLLSFVLRAVIEMGRNGVGKGRSRFRITTVEEYSPLLDATRRLLRGRTVRRPLLHVDSQAVEAAISRLPADTTTLELVTPMRLTAQGKLVKRFEPPTFFQRLIERCQAMAVYYGESEAATSAQWRQVSEVVTCAASALHVDDDSQWYEVESGSRRLGRTTPISGIMGQVQLRGDLTHLLPWLLWGHSLHVGKDAVKGNGWYRIVDL